MDVQKVSIDFAGRPLTLETGRMARQADAAVFVSYGDTMALVTVTIDRTVREGVDFLPLRVDFEEKMYAVGRIPGGFFKREGRPSEEAILTCRKIDRPIRPLLPSGLRNDVQVIATALSSENQNSMGLACMIGASAALALTPLRFAGPFAAAQVGRVHDGLVLNPSFEELEGGDLDLLLAATRDGVVMMEMTGLSVPEEVVAQSIEMATAGCQPVCDMIDQLVSRVGKPREELRLWEPREEIVTYVQQAAADRLADAVRTADKRARDEAFNAIRQELEEALLAKCPDAAPDIQATMDDITKGYTRRLILEESARTDGRARDELRPITAEVALLPRAHGSALFTRGQTQALTVTTLGATRDQKLVRTLQEEEYHRFMHQYNFPPFSVGEVRPLRAPGRREIGHGALAQKALDRVLPTEEEFPYTIRLVSEIIESNGSSSMAAVCGSTLALMDAGVPISAPVAGVSVGVVYESPERYALLTDIQGLEDQLGSDMDFKIAGTREGVNAIHLDMKTPGLPKQVLWEALQQACIARLHILDIMAEALPYPRAELSPYAPRIFMMEVDRDKIGLIIGPGGKTIRRIQEECDVDIDVEDDGRVFIAAQTEEGARKAREQIHELVRELAVGDILAGRVVRTTPFGAFVEVGPGKEGLIHISHLAWEHVNRTEDVVREGDEIQTKVIDIDEEGKIRLSLKELQPRPQTVGAARGRGGGGGAPRRSDGRDARSSRDDRRRQDGPAPERPGSPTGRIYYREKKKRD